MGERVGLGEFVNYYPQPAFWRYAAARSYRARAGAGSQSTTYGRALRCPRRPDPKSPQRHLLEIWRDLNITVVFITHDLEEAVLLADKIFVLAPKPGRLVATLPIDIPRTKDDLERDKYGLEFERVFKELSALLAASVTLINHQ